MRIRDVSHSCMCVTDEDYHSASLLPRLKEIQSRIRLIRPGTFAPDRGLLEEIAAPDCRGPEAAAGHRRADPAFGARLSQQAEVEPRAFEAYVEPLRYKCELCRIPRNS